MKAHERRRCQRPNKVVAQVENIARQTHPVDNKASRFGNPAFKTFYDEMEKVIRSLYRLPGPPEYDIKIWQAPTLHAELGVSEAATPELQVYFTTSRGNRANALRDGTQFPLLTVRTGHASPPVYIPAGSHGVWGLPFLFGSAQLQTHPSPKAIHVPEIIKKDDMHEIHKFREYIKTLRWHSLMLDDISTDKVNVGMIKMDDAKLLGKLTVVQHFFFGSILPQREPPLASCEAPQKHRGHVHEGWGDCCGGARQLRAIEGPGRRPVPFD
ncbi:hypothetical protein V8E55_011888 [Tylopilus felleus]